MPNDENKVMEAFFAAMKAGYANPNAIKRTIPNLPGSKSITVEHGQFLIVDAWVVNPKSDKSSGDTWIFKNDQAVWKMSYQGEYPPHAIKFLKNALQEAYGHNDFVGGRGPLFFSSGIRTYTNFPEGDWKNFHGLEQVLNQYQEIVGWHEYQGLYLL